MSMFQPAEFNPSRRSRTSPPIWTRSHSQTSKMARRILALLCAIAFAAPALAKTADGKQKLVLVAGKPSHPPRMHEFNAGVQLLAKCLANVPALKVEFVLNGWPADESIFDGADAVIF